MGALDKKPLRRGRKYDDALEGARVIFMRSGFEAANVDDIAREAGVSKATLYSYFPDKTQMFTAVLEQELRRHAQPVLDPEKPDATIEEILFDQCRTFIAFLTSEDALVLFRVFLTESARFPELGQQFYGAGPDVMIHLFRDFLATPRVARELDIPDPLLAAHHLHILCHHDLFLKRMFRVSDSPTQEEIEKVARSTVETFLARFGRKTPTPKAVKL